MVVDETRMMTHGESEHNKDTLTVTKQNTRVLSPRSTQTRLQMYDFKMREDALSWQSCWFVTEVILQNSKKKKIKEMEGTGMTPLKPDSLLNKRTELSDRTLQDYDEFQEDTTLNSAEHGPVSLTSTLN